MMEMKSGSIAKHTEQYASAQPQWFALSVRTNCEREAVSFLENHLYIQVQKPVDGKPVVEIQKVEVETYIPIQRKVKDNENGRVLINYQVLPNLVFVKFVPTIRRIDAIRHSSKVYDFYNIPGTTHPAPIPDCQMLHFQKMLKGSTHLISFRNAREVRRGTEVLVVRGSLRGLRGHLAKDPTDQDLIYVDLNILGYACTAIDKTQVRIIAPEL